MPNLASSFIRLALAFLVPLGNGVPAALASTSSAQAAGWRYALGHQAEIIDLILREYDETLASEMNRARRNGSSLSLLMFDVDFFKKYNDALVHPAGDECLKKVAAALRNNAQRAGEFAARIGGEEFAVVTNVDASQAGALAERIRREIADMRIPHPGSPFGVVTVSIGTSTFERCSAQHRHDQLIRQADEALYRAKREGRNRHSAALAGAGLART